jgi:RNA polymerase sigma-70 factor (ECF subfamily)
VRGGSRFGDLHGSRPEEGAITKVAQVDPAEAELVRKARGGNLFAFEELVKRHQQRVYAVARRIVRRHDVADDVAQETFLRAYRALDSFDLERPFGPWIARIAANLAVNYVRSKQAQEQALPETLLDTAAPDTNPLGAVLDREAATLLQQALEALPVEQRAVFVLRTAEDLSYRDIAEALGISLGTVMSRLSRARERLRGALLPYLGAAAQRADGGRA